MVLAMAPPIVRTGRVLVVSIGAGPACRRGVTPPAAEAAPAVPPAPPPPAADLAGLRTTYDLLTNRAHAR